MFDKSYNYYIKLLLILAASVSTAYLLMLGWFNMLSLDDYGFAAELSHYSPWGWTKLMYLTWQGRFSCFFVSGIIFRIWGYAPSLFSWTIIHLLLGYSVMYLYARDVLHIQDTTDRISITVLVTNITIMSVFELSTFYWLCCAVYFLSVYLTLLLFYALYVSKWKQWARAVVAMLSALYISGSTENYTPLVLMVLGLIWLYDIIQDTKQSSFKKAFCRHWLEFVVCAILGIGFLVMVLAPGNAARMQNGGEVVGFMYHFQLGLFIKKTIIANVVFALRLISRSLYWIGLLPLFMLVGKSTQVKKIAIMSGNLGKNLLIATLFLLGFIFIAVTACVYGIGYYPPLRSMSYMSFAVVAYICYVGCLLGCRMEKKKADKTVVHLAAFVLVGWTLFSGYECVKEYPEAKRYHAFSQQRKELVQQQIEAKRTDVLYVDAFVAPKWKNTYSYFRTTINRCVGSKKVVNELYFPYVISNLDRKRPNDFRNKGFKDYYQANFEILEK